MCLCVFMYVYFIFWTKSHAMPYPFHSQSLHANMHQASSRMTESMWWEIFSGPSSPPGYRIVMAMQWAEKMGGERERCDHSLSVGIYLCFLRHESVMLLFFFYWQSRGDYVTCLMGFDDDHFKFTLFKSYPFSMKFFKMHLFEKQNDRKRHKEL